MLAVRCIVTGWAGGVLVLAITGLKLLLLLAKRLLRHVERRLCMLDASTYRLLGRGRHG